MSDAERVQFIMDNASPDSVARFIYAASLGKVAGAKIDTIGNAILYASERYTGNDFATFADACDEYPNTLPLAEKMSILSKVGTFAADALGYELGLSYVGQIRENHLTPQDVDREIAEFKKACGNNTEMFDRFMIGFRVALENDHGKDLKEEIYTKYTSKQ